jgi:predicted RNA-binding Zn ribbon-like protein
MTREHSFHEHGFGKVAPWVDLANSEEWDGFGKREDHLADPKWLEVFLTHWKLSPLQASRAPRGQLLKLRDLLRHAAEKLSAGRSLGPQELSALNLALKVPARQRLVQHQNGLRSELVPVKNDWSWVIARIAASLAEMLTNGAAERMKICANGDCRWVFYDPTKARIKRWCKDSRCGNRARVRRARAAEKRTAQ